MISQTSPAHMNSAFPLGEATTTEPFIKFSWNGKFRPYPHTANHKSTAIVEPVQYLSGSRAFNGKGRDAGAQAVIYGAILIAPGLGQAKSPSLALGIVTEWPRRTSGAARGAKRVEPGLPSNAR